MASSARPGLRAHLARVAPHPLVCIHFIAASHALASLIAASPWLVSHAMGAAIWPFLLWFLYASSIACGAAPHSLPPTSLPSISVAPLILPEEGMGIFLENGVTKKSVAPGARSAALCEPFTGAAATPASDSTRAETRRKKTAIIFSGSDRRVEPNRAVRPLL